MDGRDARRSDLAPGDDERRVLEAVLELERALHDFERAYVEWTQASGLDAPIRRGLLTQAEARLLAARVALETLERELAEAREAGSTEH